MPWSKTFFVGASTSSYSRSLKSEMASLSVSDGLVLLDSRRIILPIPAVKPVLQLLHASHSGINKTILLARGLYFWPGMVNDVKQMVSSRRECMKLLQSQPSNPMTTAPPSRHFGHTLASIFSALAANCSLSVWTIGADTPSFAPSALSPLNPSSIF